MSAPAGTPIPAGDFLLHPLITPVRSPARDSSRSKPTEAAAAIMADVSNALQLS